MSLRISDPRPQHGPQPLDLAHELGDAVQRDLGGGEGQRSGNKRRGSAQGKARISDPLRASCATHGWRGWQAFFCAHRRPLVNPAETNDE